MPPLELPVTSPLEHDRACALALIVMCLCCSRKIGHQTDGDQLTADQIDRVGACSRSSDAAVPGDAALVACAEELIRRNGYTDAPMQLPVRLEPVHDGESRQAMEQRRRRSLIAGAVAICHAEREKTYDVVFKARDGDARAVAVPPSLVGIRMVHQEIRLSAVMAGEIARCRLTLKGHSPR
jgi:hypothetical protein